MRTRLLFSEEDEVRKKKTLIVVLAFLLIPLLLGLYAAMGPEGGLIAGATPTALPSPGAVATATPPIPTPTTTATPTATATTKATATPAATATAKATATPHSIPTSVRPELTATPTLVRPEPTATPTTVPIVLEPTSTPTPVRPEPTATLTAVSVALEPTPTPTVVPIVSLNAPVITTPPDGSVLKDDRPTITGTAPPNTTVQLYDDGSLLGTATADAQGDWALVADEPLETGEHVVTAIANDDAGRTSEPSVAVTLTIAVDRLPVTGGGSWLERWLDKLLSIAVP